ncbi:MAG: AMP-binding protein [Phycisphaerae bacterium]
MGTQAPNACERIRDRLAGHHILVTGSTGFLAKVFVEKLLRGVDTIGGIHLLVRRRPGGPAPQQRVVRDVLGSNAFNRLRAMRGDAFDELCDAKVHVVGGDLTKPRLGLSASAYDRLQSRITLVVNSAATVTFDERVDLAIELNTLGPVRLLEFAQDCGDIPLMHVSTCYVCGARDGEVAEDFSAPPHAVDRLPRRADGAYDLDRVIEEMQAEAAEIRHRFSVDAEQCRRRLIDTGMQRARASGWNDTYTFTKWIGEQLLVRRHGAVPLVMFRPAIIEGSFEEPAPGWIDGLRMADPIIVAYGRGKLTAFPARRDIAIDLIPVDFVANAMIAVLPVGGARRSDAIVYQCGSSHRNPLALRDLVHAVEEAFRLRPMTGDNGGAIRPGRMYFAEREAFIRKWQARLRRVTLMKSVLSRVNANGKRVRKLAGAARQIAQLLYFAKIYAPYTHMDLRFRDDALRSVARRLHPDDRGAFNFDVSRIDWRDYLVNRHVPGLRSFVLGTGGEPSPRIRSAEAAEPVRAGGESFDAQTLYEVFARSAVRFPDRPALQIRRNGRWQRYTYHEALQATGTIMKRLGERGIGLGDRVAICANSCPEWGLVYMAIMRAGATAVPLDPQLPPADAWEAARFVDAKLMCACPATRDGLAASRSPQDAAAVLIREPFVPPPGASRDAAPAPAPTDGGSVASILFTSGTTVAPKAVQLTHRNLIANAAALVSVHPVFHTDQFVSVLPMYHAFEFTGGFLIPIASGATITYVDQFKSSEIVSVMQATGTTVMLVVPRLLHLFSAAIHNKVAAGGRLRRAAFRLLGTLSDLSGRRFGRSLFRAVHKSFGGHMRLFVSGGSRLDTDLYHTFDRMGLPVCEGYGLTETSPVLTVNPPGAVRPGSVGKPLPNVDVEIRNQNSEGIGEVWVRGPNITCGYFNNPDATNELLVDGWLRTGDLGRISDDGYLSLTGRSKDLIVTAAGKNVYPDEVEFHYRDLPYTKELCVLAMPSPDGFGDAVHAVIVIDRDAAPELDRSSIEREIRSAVASISEALPTHQRLTALHFWDRDLPRTSTLKAKRGLIREIVCAESGADGEPPIESPMPDRGPAAGDDAPPDVANGVAFAAVRRILGRQCDRPPDTITPAMHLLLDLGIDSIGKIDAIGKVETAFRMTIDDRTGAQIARVADLLRVIGHRKPQAGAARDSSIWRRRVMAGATGTKTNGQLPPPLMPVRWLLRGGVGLFMHTYVRVQVRGARNIPATGPFILAPNHASHLDSPAVLTAVNGRRRVWVAGAEDYFFDTHVKRFLFGKVLDIIAVDRYADGLEGLRRCARALHQGDGLLIFPEGTRSPTGALQPFKIGIAVLAVEQRVPIIPVHIDRTHDLLAKGRRFVRPGAVTVTFAEPVLPPAADETTDHYAVFRELTQHVHHAVTRLAGKVAAP